ncbi:hypothetical protein PO909_001067 [Leuciscus waleckii]
MGVVNFASLNVNGARESRKRAQLFELMTQKKIDVLFTQETHSDLSNVSDWAMEFDGLSVLSHSTSVSGGVAILFSKSFIPVSYKVDEIIKGRLLMVKAFYENNFSFVLICVYVPNAAIERMLVLNTLCKVLSDCDSESLLLLGGDFNCTENVLDRNHVKPHMQSRRRLVQLMKSHDIIDIWRNFHYTQRQYTWVHAYENNLSLARLDRFYGFKHQLNFFKDCSICPVGFSDHSLVKCEIFFDCVKPKSAYWHFNSTLLCDKHFIDVFKFFWVNAQSMKSSFQTLQQWWEFVKAQIKQLCQQYTLNVTRDKIGSIRNLEEDLVKLQELFELTKNGTHLESFKKKKASLTELLDLSTQGAIIRSRFQSIESMDAPSKFFFNMERKNGQNRFIHALRSETGVLLRNPLEIRNRAVQFYEDLYKSELLGTRGLNNVFLENMPQVSEEANTGINKALSTEELERALKSMENGKTPGIDGISIDFYKVFWAEVGPDLLEVLNQSLIDGQLPKSCRRAIITLLPKKGDLSEIKNWRPVSLLCNDYKILSKALANRLGEVLDQIIHSDQTYCVPGRKIFDNISFIRDILDNGKTFSDFGLISVDQEKAFDRVEHSYLWSVFEAFGFSPSFTSMIKALYCDVESMLKLNGDLCSPFKVLRGVRQGCALSGMLYTLALEPLLNKLRAEMSGVVMPNSTHTVKLSAYADDVVVLIKDQNDVNMMLRLLEEFKSVSSAKVNWQKSEAISVGSWLLEWRENGPPQLPQQCQWTRDGFKILGIYFGTDEYMEKNWEGLSDKLIGRIQRWRWILPQLSYRGRVLIINNLAASMLWHKLTVLNPPKDFFIKIQKAFVDFFWNGHHWLPPGVLYLPVAEGGQGLIHVESKMKAMRLQTLKKILYWTDRVSWIPLSLILLQNMTNVKLDRQLFLIEKSHDPETRLSYVDFYASVLKAWGLFEMTRDNNEHYGILEPLFFNPLFKIQSSVLNSLFAMFSKAGLVRIIDLLDLHNGQWKSVQTLADQVGLRSLRTMDGFVNSLKASFPTGFLSFLNESIYNDAVPQMFPVLKVRPKKLEINVNGQVLLLKGYEASDFPSIGKKTLYQMCVKDAHCKQLRERVDSKWRIYLSAPRKLLPLGGFYISLKYQREVGIFSGGSSMV